MAKPDDVLQGTLDMLILKAVSLGALHGYGVLLRIQQLSNERLQIQQGSLYPALYPARAPGAHRQRVGRVREQAQSQILLADRGRPPAPARTDPRLEPHGRDHRRRAQDVARGL